MVYYKKYRDNVIKLTLSLYLITGMFIRIIIINKHMKAVSI